MRMIDADALEEEFKKEFDQVRTMDIPKGEEQYWDGYEDGVCTGWVMVSEEGHFAPTIDAVSVVRCKECKHYFYDELNDCKMCYIHEYGEIWEDNDYCSYGERKTDDGSD